MTLAALRQTFFGLLAVVVSLPVLFAIHRALSLGMPPVGGVVLLGASVVAAFVLAGVLGHLTGQARGGAGLASLGGFVAGLIICGLVAPFYGSLVVEGLAREATSLAWRERGKLEGAARNALTPENGARAQPQERAREFGAQLAQEGRVAGVALLKLGVAQLSAFALLFWALLGPPFAAALECRRARRR